MTLLFVAGMVLIGWVLSDRAEASERSADGPAIPVLVGDDTGVAQNIDAIAAVTVQAVEQTRRTPEAVVETAVRAGVELQAKAVAAVRPITEVVAEVPRVVPVPPSSGRKPPPPTGRSGDRAVAPPPAVGAAPTPGGISQAPEPQAAAPEPAPAAVPAVAHSPAGPTDSTDGEPSAVRGVMSIPTMSFPMPSTDADSHRHQAPARESAGSDHTVVGSAQRGGAPGGLPLSTSPITAARPAPLPDTGEPDSELVDRPREVPVSPA